MTASKQRKLAELFRSSSRFQLSDFEIGNALRTDRFPEIACKNAGQVAGWKESDTFARSYRGVA